MCYVCDSGASLLRVHTSRIVNLHKSPKGYNCHLLSFLKSSKLHEIFLKLWRHLRSISSLILFYNEPLCTWMYKVKTVHYTMAWGSSTTDSLFYFLSSLPVPPPPSNHGSLWVLPVISLLLTDTVSPVRASLSICWERFRGSQEEDDRWPLSIQS